MAPSIQSPILCFISQNKPEDSQGLTFLRLMRTLIHRDFLIPSVWSFGTCCFKTCFWLNHLWSQSYLQFQRTVAVLLPFFFLWCTLYFFLPPPGLYELIWMTYQWRGRGLCFKNHLFNWEGQKLRSFNQEIESYCDDLIYNQLSLVVKDHFSSAPVFLRLLIFVFLLGCL